MIPSSRPLFSSAVAWLCVAAASLYASPAAAQYVDRDDSVRFASEFDETEVMFVARTRAITIPDAALDLFFDRHTGFWDDGANLAYGGEFTWRKKDEYEIGFAVEWADLSMPAGFWLDDEGQPDEAEWTEVDLQMLSFVVSTYWFWDVEPWFSPYVGGGIGPAFLLGNYTKYKPRPGTDCSAQVNTGDFDADACLGAGGEPDLDAEFQPADEEDLPPVFAIVNLTGGLRFNLGEHVVLKLEAGLYTYLYAGAGLGVQF